MVPYQLNMKTGPTPGKIIQLSKAELSLGRDLSNDIFISDADVSRKHARLVQQGDGYLLEDLGSTNGTFINGSRLTAAQYLQSGDLIKFGESVELAYELPGFDAQATVLAGLKPEYTPPPVSDEIPDPMPIPVPPVAAYTPETFIAPEPRPASAPTSYVSEQPPVVPQFEYQPVSEEPKKGKKTGLFIGIGCVVLLCLCVVVVFAVYKFFPDITTLFQ